MDTTITQLYPNNAVTPNRVIKRRAACDECRNKKLKCTGEYPQCRRCARECMACVYSAQKQMGRPKKRPRAEDEATKKPHKNRTSISWDARDAHSYDDMGTQDGVPLAPAFVPEGSLQSWLQYSEEWAGDICVPALTPDSSNHSPPLDLPPELQAPSSNIMTNVQGSQHLDASPRLLLDPALGATTSPQNSMTYLGLPPDQISCACLSTIYLTLSTLQTMDTANITFPFSLHPLREAMHTASSVLDCQQCPTKFISAMQNTQLLGTLLMSIAEKYSKVLAHITHESTRATSANETKKFRLADLNTSTSHLHAGGLGCTAAFSINLSPEEWRSMCKKVVRAEVYGPADGNDCCPYFLGVIRQMEERQDKWHTSDHRAKVVDFPHDLQGEPIIRGMDDQTKEDRLCLRLVGYTRKLVEGFDWV